VVDKQPAKARPQGPPGKLRRWVRRRIIVNPAFQFRMLLPIVIFAALQSVLLGLVVFYPLHRNAAQDPDQIVQAVLNEQFLSLQVRFWPMLLIAAAVTSIYTLIRSNRVAGPLYKLQRGLMRMSEGEYMNMRFRNKDELREFEAVANRLAQRMEALASGNLRKTSQLEGRIKWLKTRLEMQELPRGEIERELDAILHEFGQVQIMREGAS
jgi:hypothetical protein